MYKTDSPGMIKSKILEKYRGRPDVTEEDIAACIEDVAELERNNKLFTPDTYGEMAAQYKDGSRTVKALCLHVAHTCNLNCEYCFASQGKYHGDRALMPLK